MLQLWDPVSSLKDFDDDDDDVVVVVGAVVVVVMCFLILISVMSVCCFLLCSLLSICCMLPKPNSRSQANPKCQFSLGASNVAPSSMSPRLHPSFGRRGRSRSCGARRGSTVVVIAVLVVEPK